MLDELVAVDHELKDRAERAARSRLAQVEADDVANAVAAALLALDQEDLAANAGRTRYGYVEPTEAAWSLLEAAVEPWLEDITRRASLGLTEAARRLGLGTLQALAVRRPSHPQRRPAGLLGTRLPRRDHGSRRRAAPRLGHRTDRHRTGSRIRRDMTAPADVGFADAEGLSSPAPATKAHHQQ